MSWRNDEVRDIERDIVREGAGDALVLEEADVRRELDAEDVLREVVRRRDAVKIV